MFAKIVDGKLVKFPYSVDDMRADNPDVQVDDTPTAEQLVACNAKTASWGTAPKQSSRTHIFSLGYENNADGSVTVTYVPEPLPIEVASINMRIARDDALTRCDWVVTRAFESGTSIPQAYLDYRQKLRDLPSQAGFPYTYDWPKEP